MARTPDRTPHAAALAILLALLISLGTFAYVSENPFAVGPIAVVLMVLALSGLCLLLGLAPFVLIAGALAGAVPLSGALVGGGTLASAVLQLFLPGPWDRCARWLSCLLWVGSMLFLVGHCAAQFD